ETGDVWSPESLEVVCCAVCEKDPWVESCWIQKSISLTGKINELPPANKRPSNDSNEKEHSVVPP
ncbi:hypothetical protein P7K49_005642, partial [Saguinus oedipus]